MAEKLSVSAEEYNELLQKLRESEKSNRQLARELRSLEKRNALYNINTVTQKSLANVAAREKKIAEESNIAKSMFLARMSHEIRTPITAVLGISEIEMQNPVLSVTTRDAFYKIYDSADFLLGLINDILNLSKIESGKMSVLWEEYETATMISCVERLRFVNPSNKDIKFKLAVDKDLPRMLVGDVLRIEQIISNLLSNSFKYTEVGVVKLSFMCEKKNDGTALVISVQDTGLGMTKVQLESLFNEYTRFHEREKSHVGGTGLGMTIVYNLVQLMEGTIELKSEVGKGTEVTVRLPQKGTVSQQEVLGEQEALRLQKFEVGVRAAEKRFNFVPEPMPYGKVLVVDDIDTNLYVAKGLLEFYSLDIETCDSGYEAIDKIKQGEVYDIIFMDHMMPILDGIETVRIMRSTGYTKPIVALTANAMIGQEEIFIENGFDGFISKPIQTEHLNAALIKHVRDKQPPEVIEKAVSSRIQPVSLGAAFINGFQSNTDMLEKFRKDFAKTKRNAFAELQKSLKRGDTKNAHIIAHSIKGLAELIMESELANAAKVIEMALATGENVDAAELLIFEEELAKVLEGIGIPEDYTTPDDRMLDKEKAVALFDKLEPLLKSGNADCLNLLDELRQIPETAIIVRQIEEFNFKPALSNLGTLRAILLT